MKTKKKTSGAKRPWYAPQPRWYAEDVDGLGVFLMRRERTAYNVRDVARCQSLAAAEKLAAALNRGERNAGRVEGLYLSLLRLFGAVRASRKPTFAKLASERLTAAMIEAERVLGEKIRGLKPAAQNRGSVRGGM